MGVGLAEGAAAEEAGVGGEGGGVGGFYYFVLGPVYEGGFGAGVAAPEDEDEMGDLGVEVLDDVLGEGLPAFAAMGGGAMGFDGENIV